MSKRIEDLKSPMTRWRGRIRTIASAVLNKFSSRQLFWLGFAFLCIVTTLLLFNPSWNSSSEHVYKEGDIARETIIAPADIHFVDEAETERIRSSARETVDPIFNFEPRRAEEAVQTFRTAWEDAERKSKAAANSNRSANSNKLEMPAGTKAGSDLAKVFAMRKFSPNELEAVARIVRENAGGDIYGDQDEQFLQGQIFDRRSTKADRFSSVREPVDFDDEAFRGP
jgi:membrane-associated HD superfamily phosphohydrolase